MACGEYDLYIAFATRYNWTPEQVNELDPHFVDELLMRWEAENEKAEKDRKQREAESKAKRGKR